jgi:hypothetical protein
MTSSLTSLSSRAFELTTEAWRRGAELIDFAEYEELVRRPEGLPSIDLAATRTVIEEAMGRFAEGKRPEQSDAWLAPRLHGALRLSRREAAHNGVWATLTMVEFPSYVRWRFGSDEKAAPADRFHGDPTTKNALGRLWWGAELFRDGPDYSPVETAFRSQDLMNNLFRADIAHHRPVAQGAVAVLFPPNEPALSGDDANALAKAANSTATTLLLDAIAPDEPLDATARDRWMCESIDALLLIEDAGQGPTDPPVPTGSVAAIAALFGELLTEAPRRRRGRDEG